jgi:tRNA (guanine-N(7)-)-methyltransferase
VEIGCGNGHFIVALAQQNRDRFYLGIDLKKARCEKALRKVEKRALDNIGIVCARAEDVIERLPLAQVAVFHLYFPDPWPKNRHRRRRFFRMPQVDLLATRLSPGGRLCFVTDFYDYYVQAKVLVLLNPALALSAQPPPHDALVSMFGKRFVEWGKDIYFLNAFRGESGSDRADPSPDETSE